MLPQYLQNMQQNQLTLRK